MSLQRYERMEWGTIWANFIIWLMTGYYFYPQFWV